MGAIITKMLGKVQDTDSQFQLRHVNSLETNLLIHVAAMTFLNPAQNWIFKRNFHSQTLEGQLNPTGQPRICLLGEVTTGAVNRREHCNDKPDPSRAAGCGWTWECRPGDLLQVGITTLPHSQVEFVRKVFPRSWQGDGWASSAEPRQRIPLNKCMTTLYSSWGKGTFPFWFLCVLPVFPERENEQT